MYKNERIVICIPARYASTRLPGKPLADIKGTPMIIRVAQHMQLSKYADHVVVLTDHQLIKDKCEEFSISVEMTDTKHTCGTDRLIEYKIRSEFDYYVNVQGDEPMVKASEIDQLISYSIDRDATISTPISKITDASTLFDYNKVKCVFDAGYNAMYFSRSAIPAQRETPYKEWIQYADYYKHIGIYLFKQSALSTIEGLEPTILEKVESLEQLRWMHFGLTLTCFECQIDSMSVDTAEDLLKIQGYF